MRERSSQARLSGRCALVTGAAAGLGRAVTELFVEHGAKVLAVDLDEQGLSSLQHNPNIVCCVADISDQEQVEQLALAHPNVSVIVNCAAIVHDGTILECSPEDWRRSFSVNVEGMYFVARAWLPGMCEARNGSIVNIASAVSSLHASPNRSAYAATKAAVIGLTKSIAVDFMRSGIRANAICPGPLNSPSFQARFVEEGKSGSRQAELARSLPAGRIGEPVEAAYAALFLASEESSYLNGQAIILDGGWKL